ncbi:LPS-assembly protein [Giesbergeria anulus]|uniref:LPS-assembly protein LptD n=1 Tax=Giesbergeria anulus TaxID=180197 RepID=A0A1H9RTM3_9BURK|nr:LPS-assembly protein [Giesbergeria anulus]
MPDLLRTPSLPVRSLTRHAPPCTRTALAQQVATALCLLPLWAPAQNREEAPTTAPLVLRASPQLQETIAESVRAQMPTFVSGDHIEGQPDVRAVLEGNAELRRADTVVRAQRMEYAVPEDFLQAQGQVRINRAGNVYEGTLLELRVNAFEGFFDQARYQFLRNAAHGDAARVDFLDRDRAIIHQGTYTTCERSDEASWQPAWMLRADTIHLDMDEEVGRAQGAVLEFQGVPILPLPRISFPLSDKRKSGLLPPTIGINSTNGMEYVQPYYWNIAPNRDATFKGAIMTKRGVQAGAEFRYLEPNYHGELRGDFLPADRLRQDNRWSYGIKHQGNMATPLGGLGLNLSLDRVSDDYYWRDFGRAGTQISQRLLPGDATLSWAGGDMGLQLRTLKWQTLQDVSAPIVPPYDRLPQLHGRYAPTHWGVFDINIEADATRFHANRSLTGQPNTTRSYALAQISRPYLSAAGFVVPRLQWHATQYQFDTPLADGRRSASRVLPTLSVDSGLVFERETSYLGRNFLQTLEPRAFYTYTPYRNQSLLPVYDTAANDFNFATIYTENAFGGQDRLADNNLLTLGVSTRLLDPATGAEAARFGIAQRVRFSDQKVTLPGAAPLDERLSDLLLGAGVQWTPQWGLDSTVQFNPKTSQSIRTTLSTRYSPSHYRTINAAYRLQRGTSEQVDVGWQWPLNDAWGDKGLDLGLGRGQGGGRWYSVGRLNYSLQDRKLVDTVVGLEYDGCCWIGRVVLERLQSTISSANTRLLFQLEFVGFSRLSLGSNPLASLKQNIPRYQYLREQVSTPSRFSNYD